ncbi:MAG: hypothetical protein R3E79_01090 [Caldilineaceae bacterium]
MKCERTRHFGYTPDANRHSTADSHFYHRQKRGWRKGMWYHQQSPAGQHQGRPTTAGGSAQCDSSPLLSSTVTATHTPHTAPVSTVLPMQDHIAARSHSAPTPSPSKTPTVQPDGNPAQPRNRIPNRNCTEYPTVRALTPTLPLTPENTTSERRPAYP